MRSDVNLRKKLYQLLFANAPQSVSIMGVVFSLLMIQLYLSGNLGGINTYFQDRQFRLRLAPPHPHTDIALVAITDQTIQRLGWPLPRKYYVALLQRLKREGAKAIGFNFLLSTQNPQDAEADRALIRTVSESSGLVMPFFYDYSDRKSYMPLPELVSHSAALGNVSMYRGDVARFIEGGILNHKTSPPQVLFPMGVELARLYLGLPQDSLELQPDRLRIGDKIDMPLEEGGLLRINYQGPPGFFPRISLEEIIQGKSHLDFKNKIVLIGAFTPTLGDVTTSPYGDQTSLPMYGTEIQANITQNLLDQQPLFHASPLLVCIIVLLLGVCSGLLFTHYGLLQQYLILTGLSLGVLLFSFLSFNLAHLLVDTGPFLGFFALMGLGQTALINLRSYVAINNQILKLQEYEQKLPEVEIGRRLENIQLALFHVSQADWVSFRRFDADKRQLQLQSVKGRSAHAHQEVPDLPFDSLPFAFPCEIIAQAPSTRAQAFLTQQLPAGPREAYSGSARGTFVLLPIYMLNGQLYGLYELFFGSGPDEVQLTLLEEMRQVAMQSLQHYFQHEESSRGLFPGVEEKIGAMVRLVNIREMESAFFSTVLESTTNPVVVCDPIGEIRFYNDNFVHLFEPDSGAKVNSANIQELMSRFFRIQSQQWQDIWLTTLHRRRQKELQVSTERGVYHLTLTPVFGQQAEVTGVVMILTDVTKLHRQANFDKLTGLYNRRYFDELILNEFQRCERSPETPFALLMLDVDHFKSFNDTYGHQVGDQVLASFGQVLGQTVRRTDMAVRYGGEEMAVILPNTHAEKAAIVAEKIRRTIAGLQLYDSEGRPIRQITASIGVAQFAPDDVDYEAVIRRADEALYRCKDAGRNCIFMHLGSGGLVKFTNQRVA